MSDIKYYMLLRLREASTWRGIIALATAAGIQFTDAQAAAVVAAGLAVIGLIGVFFKDNPQI